MLYDLKCVVASGFSLMAATSRVRGATLVTGPQRRIKYAAAIPKVPSPL